MKKVIYISDWYEGEKQLLYKGENLNQATEIIKQYVNDTSGECDLVCNVLTEYNTYFVIEDTVLTNFLIEYTQDCIDYVNESL